MTVVALCGRRIDQAPTAVLAKNSQCISQLF
jgi:hypothetical protein